MEGTGSIGERLRAARERAFVGRSEEIAWFESLLDEEGSALVWLHAPGGTGKSSLLARWSATAERRGVAVARVDLEHVEPSPDSVLGGFAVALGLDDSEALALALMTPTRHVLVIDSWERGEAIDGWLREAFVPTLPDDTIVVLSGRREPAGPWSSDAGWRSLVRELKLANLPPEAADELLERAGVDHEHRSRLVALCHGHPLALTLVSELDATALPVQLDEAPDILRVLVSRFLSDLPSQLHRRALELCAHTRSTTEDLLRAVVDEPRGHELFTWLQALPFITASQHGLCVHGLARDAVDAELRWRDPERYRAQHAAVRMAIYERMLASGGAERERIFLDMLYLHRASRLVSAFFDFEGLGSGWAERPAPDDHDAIVSIARDHLGPEHARVVEYWIERQPESFVTLRSALGEPLLFAAHLVLEAFEEQDIRADPAIEALSKYVAARGGLRAGERVVVTRFGAGAMGGTTDGRLRHFRPMMRWLTTPGVAFSFMTIPLDERRVAAAAYLQHHRAAEAEVELDGRTVPVLVHDWRGSPVEEFLAALTDNDLAAELPPPEAKEPFRVLSEDELEAAVKDALRTYTRPSELENNPLLRSRCVREAAGDETPTPQTLRGLLREAMDELAGTPRDAKLLRALEVTYVRPAPTQEVAAERLGVPFSTFRRHLTKGVQRVVAWVIAREVQS